MVVTFHSTHLAIRAERVLIREGLRVETMPVPRHISSDCGIAIGFSRQDKEKLIQVLADNSVETEGVYILEA